MSEKETKSEATEHTCEELKKPEQAVQVPQQEVLKIEVDGMTAYNLKLQEFDKNIAAAEAQAALLKQQRAEFIYQSSINTLTEQHKESLIRKQVEEEARKRAESK